MPALSLGTTTSWLSMFGKSPISPATFRFALTEGFRSLWWANFRLRVGLLYNLNRTYTTKLHNYIADPEVTVMVQEIHSQKFNILGEVIKPGSYSLEMAATVLDAIAAAGGFRDFANQKSIYILRQNANGGESRIPFNYKKVIKGKNPQQNINLQPRDTIVVP